MAMDMRGALNLSKYYTRSEQPKYFGKALINGVEYVLKGWEKVNPNSGEVWISLLFEDPATIEKKRSEEFASSKPRMKQPAPNYLDLDDDIPF